MSSVPDQTERSLRFVVGTISLAVLCIVAIIASCTTQDLDHGDTRQREYQTTLRECLASGFTPAECGQLPERSSM